jgi:hypothetical protein
MRSHIFLYLEGKAFREALCHAKPGCGSTVQSIREASQYRPLLVDAADTFRLQAGKKHHKTKVKFLGVLLAKLGQGPSARRTSGVTSHAF